MQKQVQKIILVVLIAATPAFSYAQGADTNAFCRNFVEKAIPDYAQGGITTIVKKNLDKMGVHCMPLLPMPSKLPNKEFKELREHIYNGCVEDVSKDGANKKKFSDMLNAIPEDC